MKKILIWLLICTVEFLTIVAPSQAYAQTTTTSTNAATTAINKILSGMGTWANGSVGATANSAIQTAAGKQAQVAVTVGAGMTASRMGAIAGKVLKSGGYVGVATMVIPWLMDQAGIYVCAAPAFFCKTVTSTDDVLSPWLCGQTNTTISLEACSKAFVDAWNKLNGVTDWAHSEYQYSSNKLAVTIYIKRWNSSGVWVYKATNASRTSVPTGTSREEPATEQDMGTAVEKQVAADTSSKKGNDLYKAMAVATVPDLMPASIPVTITAPPITLPAQVKTETITNPDGTTSTRTTTTTTTITPVQKGTTIGTATLDYPETTTTTTTTKNDTTGTTSSNTSTITDTATVAKPDVVIPDDYAREPTLQKILKAVDGSNMPSVTTMDKDTDLGNIAEQNNANKTAVEAISPAGVGLTDWFPQFPTTQCENPKVPNPLTRSDHEVEICKPVDTFSKFISAVACVLALFGSVRSIQSAIRS